MSFRLMVRDIRAGEGIKVVSCTFISSDSFGYWDKY